MKLSLKKKFTVIAATGALALLAAPGQASAADYGGNGSGSGGSTASYGGGSSSSGGGFTGRTAAGSSGTTGSSSSSSSGIGSSSRLALTGVDSGDLALVGATLLGSGLVVSTTLQRRRVES